MAKKTGKVVQLVCIGVLACVVTAANIAINYYKGLIDQYLGDNSLPGEVLNPEEGDEVVQRVAEEGFVLLKNENDTLPLENVTNVNLFGWCSTDEGLLMCGGGSGDFTMRGTDGVQKDVVTLQEALEGLEDRPFQVNQDLVDYYESYCTVNRNGGTDSRAGWFNYNGDPKYFNMVEPSIDDYPDEVLESAKEFSDTALVVITRTGGESLDLPKYQRKFEPGNNPASASGTITTDDTRHYLELSTEEEDLIDYVKGNYENVVVILNTSATLECGFIDDPDIDAAIYIGTPGQSGLTSLAKMLRGTSTPSGKLADTYAYDLTTAASWANSPNANTINSSTGEKSYSSGGSGNYIDYQEGIYVGYKWYETADAEGYWDYVSNEYGQGYEGVVQYPFGYGLSYTDFDWTVKSVSPSNGAEITDDTEIEIRIDVRNTGDVQGADVVEIYYEPPYTPGGIEKSSSNLVAFAKTNILQPGEVQTLTLTFTGDDMKSYDCGDYNNNGFAGYELEKGDYKIKISKDAHNVNADADGSGVSDGVISYSVANDVKIYTDKETGYPVENRFTGENADSGVSIDGSNVDGWDIEYLSRSDFDATFPLESTDRRSYGSNFNSNGWLSTERDTDEMPTTQVDSGLRLVEDGVYNDDLICELGDPDNYDSEIWDELLDQVSVSEMQNVVMKGGYATWNIDSIGKPKMTDLDGPTGFNRHPNGAPEFTGFPGAVVVASTWNTNVAGYFGQVVGTEGRQAGVGGWYAPGMNIHRSPFDGRNYEYFSEDPILSGVIGAAVVEGAAEQGVYSYIKHFALNETENQRNGLYTWLTEQSLREIYLKPFEIAIKQGNANAVMSSYNRIGDTWTGGSYGLMTEILRNEWGFKGTVVTDYLDGSDSYKVVDQGLRAGNDIWLENGNDASASAIGFKDTSSATAVSCMREATKHVVYTYCNTRKRAIDFGNASDEVIEAVDKTSTWKIIWIVVAVVLYAALAAWAIIVIIKLVRKKETA